MKIRNFVILLIMSTLVMVTSGCSRLDTYGERISNRNITALKDVIVHPQDYIGKAITVKGKIALVCDTGCWFNLKDGDAVIYVDLEPSGFAIPQKAGRAATTEGDLMMKDGRLTLIGKGVEIR